MLSNLQQAGVESPAAATQTMATMQMDPAQRQQVEPVVIKLLSKP